MAEKTSSRLPLRSELWDLNRLRYDEKRNGLNMPKYAFSLCFLDKRLRS